MWRIQNNCNCCISGSISNNRNSSVDTGRGKLSLRTNPSPPKPCVAAPGVQGVPICQASIISPEICGEVRYPDMVKANGEGYGPCPISWIKFTWYLNDHEIDSLEHTLEVLQSLHSKLNQNILKIAWQLMNKGWRLR
jgi:hypothetical protein